MLPPVVVPLEAGHLAVCPLRRVLSGVCGPSHRPCNINMVVYHVLQEILRADYIAVALESARPTPEYVAAPVDVVALTAPRTS